VKVAIGLLLSNGFPVPVPFVLGLTDVLTATLTGTGNTLLPAERQITDARIIRTEGFPVDTARNEVCRMFLDQYDGDYLLFLDADMRHPATIAHQLLRHQVDLVTARYQMRKPPFHTVAMRKVGNGPHDYKSIAETSGLVRVDAAGAGALLIHRSVLEKVRAKVGDDWFRYQVGPNGLRTVSEDMWFFERCKALGIQAWADLDCVCTHVAAFEIDPTWNAPYRERYEAITAVAQ
jgi:hypothetical protein